MHISDVLRKIAPCDRDKPYIFISYSSDDRELVWRDALEFQRRGYNIWLDEINLDKTKASWKEDALNAISDMYCNLLVFYVSKTSLVSEACYRELLMTTDAYTIALHRGPVKFVAIDVLDAGNIAEFAAQVYDAVFANESLTKEEKHAKFLTLDNFMKKFFDSNNERVRIHPKNEPNRKMDYYDEITSAFPDRTRIWEEIEESAREAAEDTAAKLENLDTLKVQADFIADSRQEAYIQQEPAPQPVKEAPAADDGPARDAVLTRELLLQAMEAANTSDEKAFLFRKVSEVSNKKIEKAIQAYAGSTTVSRAVAICDATLFGSGKEGFLLTETRLYSSYFKKGMSIELDRVKQASQGSRSGHILIQYADGTLLDVYVNIFNKMITALLNFISDRIHP